MLPIPVRAAIVLILAISCLTCSEASRVVELIRGQREPQIEELMLRLGQLLGQLVGGQLAQLVGLHAPPVRRIGLDRQFVTGLPHGFSSKVLRDTGELEHHSAGLDDRHPELGRTLAGTHAGLSRLRRDRLVAERC